MLQYAKVFYYLYNSAKLAEIGSPIRFLIRFIILAFRHGLNLYTLTKLSSWRLKKDVAINEGETTLTWTELLAAVDACIINLNKLSFRLNHQTKVILHSPNTIDLVIMILALSRLGGHIILCPIKSPLNEMIDSLAQIKPNAIFVGGSNIELPDCHFTTFFLEAFTRGKSNKTGWLPVLPRKMGKLVIFSSGTTGQRKAIPRQFTLKQLTGLTYELISKLSLKQSTRTFITTPIAHGYGLASLSFCLSLGAHIIISSRVDGESLSKTIATQQPEIILVVPKLLERIIETVIQDEAKKTVDCEMEVKHPITEHLKSVRTIITGSDVISVSLVEKTLTRFGAILFNLYGSTEAGIISMATPDILKEAPSSVGLPLSETYLSIQDGHGKNLDPYEIGEIVVSSTLIFNGYQFDSRAQIHQYNTHDLGYLDERGYLYIVARSD